MGLEDVGYGILNWEEIIPQAKASGAQWYIVEHDMPNGHVNSITRSYNFHRRADASLETLPLSWKRAAPNLAAFEHLVYDQTGSSVPVKKIGGNDFYVVMEDGFDYHIEAGKGGCSSLGHIEVPILAGQR